MSNEIDSSKSLYFQTPNLEKLASNGMRFSRGYSSSPVCSPSRYSIQFAQSAARLKMIRVGMDTKHINHDKQITIPKKLKEINPNYATAHFGKWGIDAEPSLLGYDYHDGQNGNKEGEFVNNKTQWETTYSDDPKKIFSLSEKATNFLNEQKKCRDSGININNMVDNYNFNINFIKNNIDLYIKCFWIIPTGHIIQLGQVGPTRPG